MAEPTRPRGRAGFAPVVLAGLLASTSTAVAAARDWASATGSSAGVPVAASVPASTSAPLALALALVSLAAWGVLLVVRGRVRRAVAVVGAIAAAGVLVTALGSAGTARRDAVRAAMAQAGTGSSHGLAASLGGWFYVCVVAAAVVLAAFVVAVRASPAWPAMGTRYDAPAARAARDDGSPTSELELWRALDDGRDPTA